MLEDAIGGRLLLPTEPSGDLAMSPGFPLSGTILIAAFVLLGLLVIRNFLSVLPFLSDSVFRARGSAALENSVRVSRDRNLVAAVFVLPVILLMYRYRLYDPSFIHALAPDPRLLAVAGAFLGYLLLRYLMYLLCRPRRGDFFGIARRSGFTFFIILGLVVFPTVGVLALFGVKSLTIRWVILAESAFVYFVFFIRKGQFLSGFCSLLQVFLYLCALEILPTAALVVTAMVL